MRLKAHDCMCKRKLFTIKMGGTLVTMVYKLLKQILNMKSTAIYLVIWLLLECMILGTLWASFRNLLVPSEFWCAKHC